MSDEKPTDDAMDCPECGGTNVLWKLGICGWFWRCSDCYAAGEEDHTDG